jgi:hypothetical protein
MSNPLIDLEIDMNKFFVSAGRTLANIVDGTIDATRTAVTGTGDARKAFAAGWKTQRSMNAVKRRYGDIFEFKPVRT